MKKIWFVRKTYGWGWTPATWEGWVVILLYGVALVKIIVLVNLSSESESIRVILPIFALTAIMMLICYLKGEKPRWQWGEKTTKKD